MPIGLVRAKTRLSKRDLTKPWLELVALHITTNLPKTYILPERTLGKRKMQLQAVCEKQSQRISEERKLLVYGARLDNLYHIVKIA